MCEVLDRIEARGEERGILIGEARGRAEGKAEGRAEGKAEGAFQILSGLVKDGLISLGEAVKRLGMSEEEFKRKIAEM